MESMYLNELLTKKKSSKNWPSLHLALLGSQHQVSIIISF